MITAAAARFNVTQYEKEKEKVVTEIVNKLIDELSAQIQFLSKRGVETLTIRPYAISHIPSDGYKEPTAVRLGKILEENGYKIIRNDWKENFLELKW